MAKGKKVEHPLDREVIKAIMERKNYIDVHIRDRKAEVICTIKVKVNVLHHRFVWGWNQFQVKPVGGDKEIWKNWDQLKAYTDERELLSS